MVDNYLIVSAGIILYLCKMTFSWLGNYYTAVCK
jgi:hypothetical protein